MKSSELNKILKEIVTEELTNEGYDVPFEESMEDSTPEVVSADGNDLYLKMLDIANLDDPSLRLIVALRKAIAKRVKETNDLKVLIGVFNKEFGGYHIQQANDFRKREGKPPIKDAWEYYENEELQEGYGMSRIIKLKQRRDPDGIEKKKEPHDQLDDEPEGVHDPSSLNFDWKRFGTTPRIHDYKEVKTEVNHTQTSSGQSIIAQGAPGSVIRFATENPELIKQMRDWAADCQWKDDEDLPDMSDEEILRGVQQHYEGGIRAFIRDSNSKAEVPVGYKETTNEASTDWVSPVSAYEDGLQNGKTDKSLSQKPLGLKAGPSPNQKAYSQGYYDGYYGIKGNEYSNMKFREGYGAGDMSKDPKKAFRGARWTVKFETITESEVKSIIKDIINEIVSEMWADIGNTSGDTNKEGPTGRATEPGSDKNLVDLYKGGKPDSMAGLPSVGGGMSENADYEKWVDDYVGEKCPQCGMVAKAGEGQVLNSSNPTVHQCKCGHKWNPDNEKSTITKSKGLVKETTWQLPDETLKQYDTVKEWERDNLDGLHKYTGEPLKNYGFIYKVGDVVPSGEYNRRNAMHLWNIAKKKQQDNISLGKPLYEAKGSTSKDKLHSMLKESVHEVLKEYSEQEEQQFINSIAAISHAAVSRTSEMSPREALDKFKEINKYAETLVKFHRGTPKSVSDNTLEKTSLGVTQETISRTKNVLERMLFQKRKK
jgi:hypothetical protein